MSRALAEVEPQKLSVDRLAASNQMLDLIQAVVSNPDVSVEKVRALWEIQLQMEDRRAEAAFDEAMIEAQRRVRAIAWDKFNSTNQSHHVSYPKIDKMLRPIREDLGFTQSFDTEPGPTPEIMFVCCDVLHRGGHRRRYRIPMPIDGTGPKGGGVMTKPQAVGNGTSYGVRYLAKLIWDIPVLVDRDDTDGNEPVEYITESQAADLQALIDETKTDKKAFLAYFSSTARMEIPTLSKLPANMHKNAVAALNKKRSAPPKEVK